MDRNLFVSRTFEIYAVAVLMIFIQAQAAYAGDISHHGMYRNFGEGFPIDKTNNFSSSDNKVVSWVDLVNMKKGDVIIREYYSPNGELYFTDRYEVNWSYSGWNQHNLPVIRYLHEPGKWSVEIYINGIKKVNDSFYVYGNTTTETAEKTSVITSTHILTPTPNKTSVPPEKQTNWMLVGSAVFMILLIIAIALRARKSKIGSPIEEPKLKVNPLKKNVRMKRILSNSLSALKYSLLDKSVNSKLKAYAIFWCIWSSIWTIICILLLWDPAKESFIENIFLSTILFIFLVVLTFSPIYFAWTNRFINEKNVEKCVLESFENKYDEKLTPNLQLDIKRGFMVLANNDIDFGVRVTNNTGFTVTDVDIIIDYSEDLFEIKKSKIFRISNITPNTIRTATFILKPLGCIHNEQINALITYKDHTGKKQTLHMHPKEVHCVCPFLKGKPMNEGEYSRLAANSEFVQEGISFKGISVDDLAKFMGETCRHMLHKVREYDIEGKKVIYLSGESVGEKVFYLLTAVFQDYKGLTQVVLRAYSDKKYGLHGFMNEIADSLRHLVGSVQNAKEIGIIENTQVINIIDSVVQRTSFQMGEGAQVNIRESVVQRTNIGENKNNNIEKSTKNKEDREV